MLAHSTPPCTDVRFRTLFCARVQVIDDFIRNFFVRHGLVRTGEMFETEWYELKAAGKLDVTLGERRSGRCGTLPDCMLFAPRAWLGAIAARSCLGAIVAGMMPSQT